MFMSEKDYEAIVQIFGNLEQQELRKIEILPIAITLNENGLFASEKYQRIVREIKTTNVPHEEKADRVFKFLRTLRDHVTFEELYTALARAGHRDLAEQIIVCRFNVMGYSPDKRSLPYADSVNEYFSNIKQCADDNAFQDGKVHGLEHLISNTKEKLQLCHGHAGRRQLYADKLVATYFLLAQQSSDMSDRLNVMKRMHDSVPMDVDRTTLNVTYHAYMAVIRSIKGEFDLAEKHEQRSRSASHYCAPGLARILLGLCAQYKNNVIYFRRMRPSDITRAHSDFCDVMHMLGSLQHGQDLYGTIAKLEMVHTLLGIDWNLKVCDISHVSPDNIEQANAILSTLGEPRLIRRKLLYFLCRARVREAESREEAEELARQAFMLADEGCYYRVEKANIKKYLAILSGKRLPSPSM